MNPQVRDIIQDILTSYCKPRTGSQSREGAYAGTDVPRTAPQMRAVMEDSTTSFKANSWDLDSVELVSAVDMGMEAYTNTLAGWINKPLATDAPTAVVEWQKQART